MTDQITVPRATWDALREALQAVRPADSLSDSRLRLVVRELAALTAANAVSAPRGLFVGMIASHGPDFVDEMAAIDVEPEALITVESSLRFRLECEQQKSADLLDEVRELKGKLFKARQPQAQGEAVNIEALCARIKAADDASADMDYMLDSNDCIHVLRGTWKGPMLNDMPPHPQATEPAWRPIETAPFYTDVLVSIEGGGVTIGSAAPKFGWTWYETDNAPEDAKAIGWMPLPASPEAKQ